MDYSNARQLAEDIGRAIDLADAGEDIASPAVALLANLAAMPLYLARDTYWLLTGRFAGTMSWHGSRSHSRKDIVQRVSNRLTAHARSVARNSV